MIWIYRLLIAPLGFLLVLILSPFQSKIRAGLGLRLRRHHFQRRPAIGQPAASRPAGSRPVKVWFHCASGEFEYAKPVLRSLKEKDPNLWIAVSYFSPSYRQAVENFPFVDEAFPLSIDLPQAVLSQIRQLRPAVVAISRTDLWPEFLYQLRRENIPCLLFSATLSSTQAKLRWPFSSILKFRLQFLDEIHCVSLQDKEQFEKLFPAEKIRISGDTRYDEVAYRVATPRVTSFLDNRPWPGPVLVAGSTWPADEKLVLTAVAGLLEHKQLYLVLVPHEPSSQAIAAIEKQLTGYRLKYSLSSRFDPSANTVIVDRTGLLFDLYRAADFAYVGGAFGRGVHSVMEPLSHGLRCWIGPNCQGSREALEFGKSDYGDGRSTVQVVLNSQDFETNLRNNINLWAEGRLDALKQALKIRVADRTGASQKVRDSIFYRVTQGKK